MQNPGWGNGRCKATTGGEESCVLVWFLLPRSHVMEIRTSPGSKVQEKARKRSYWELGGTSASLGPLLGWPSLSRQSAGQREEYSGHSALRVPVFRVWRA